MNKAIPRPGPHSGKGYGLVSQERRCDIHAVFELRMVNQADFNVRTMCRVLKVSAAGYYGWRNRAPRPRRLAKAVLM